MTRVGEWIGRLISFIRNFAFRSNSQVDERFQFYKFGENAFNCKSANNSEDQLVKESIVPSAC